jgi:hypothetical protein
MLVIARVPDNESVFTLLLQTKLARNLGLAATDLTERTATRNPRSRCSIESRLWR